MAGIVVASVYLVHDFNRVLWLSQSRVSVRIMNARQCIPLSPPSMVGRVNRGLRSRHPYAMMHATMMLFQYVRVFLQSIGRQRLQVRERCIFSR